MTPLVIDPYNLIGLPSLEPVFADMARYKCDLIATFCRDYAYADITGPLAGVYRRLARETKARGLFAGIYIEVSKTRGDVVGPLEAQRHSDDTPAVIDEAGFYASFASERWKEHVRSLIRMFVVDHGYGVLLLGEPIYKVDIPGHSDPFYEKFQATYPGVPYPQATAETPEYLKVQKLKGEVLQAFCREMGDYAKSVGVAYAGVVSGRFSRFPASEAEACDPPRCCDNGRIISYPAFDFATVDLATNVRSDGRTGALHSYTEMMASSVGKPVSIVTGIFGDFVSRPKSAGKDLVAMQKSAIGAIAAAPSGTALVWPVDGEALDTHTLELLNTISEVTYRVSASRGRGAFVIADSGLQHADPAPCTVWREHYWPLMRDMFVVHQRPALTFSAEAIEQHLADNPQLRAIALEEHFPLTKEQVEVILKWWADASDARGLMVIGTGRGFSADPNKPGPQPLSETFPGLLERIGLKEVGSGTIGTEDTGPVRLSRKGAQKPWLPPDGTEVSLSHIADVHRIFGSRTEILYTDQTGRPIITELVEGRSRACFCALGSSEITSAIISGMVMHGSQTLRPSPQTMLRSDQDILWCHSSDGYAVIGNYSDEEAVVNIVKRPAAFWDVSNGEMIRNDQMVFRLKPDSARIIRWIPKTTKLYDIQNLAYVKTINAGAGRADMVLRTKTDTRFIVKSAPRKITVDDEPHRRFTAETRKDYVILTLNDLEPDEHLITFLW